MGGASIWRSASPPVAGGGRRRVLVVHDEMAVLRWLSRAVQTVHDVVSVASPSDALARIGHADRWDAVLAPIMMSEMSGFEFSACLRKARADLGDRLALMTSANVAAHVRNLQAGSRVRIVRRPDTLDAFVALLAEVTCPQE